MIKVQNVCYVDGNIIIGAHWCVFVGAFIGTGRLAVSHYIVHIKTLVFLRVLFKRPFSCEISKSPEWTSTKTYACTEPMNQVAKNLITFTSSSDALLHLLLVCLHSLRSHNIFFQNAASIPASSNDRLNSFASISSTNHSRKCANYVGGCVENSDLIVWVLLLLRLNSSVYIEDNDLIEQIDRYGVRISTLHNTSNAHMYISVENSA